MSEPRKVDLGSAPTDAPERAPHVKDRARAESDSEGVNVHDVTVDHDLADNLDGLLEFFGYDPANFQVVDDTVRTSKWQQSKGLEDGTRSTVWLWSYSARFRRCAPRLAPADVDEVREYIRSWSSLTPPPVDSYAHGSTFVVLLADWQLGKGRHGIPQLVRFLRETFDRVVARIAELKAAGRDIECIALVNMGDPTEGCDGHYDQQRANTATQREQLRTVMDLWVEITRMVAPLAARIQWVSVLCNHGEWQRRNGSKGNVTDDSDNIGGYLADELRRFFEDRPDYAHVKFEIPHDEMTVQLPLSGIPCAFAHGHKISGSGEKGEKDWLTAQSIRLLRTHGREPRLWFTAHRHHDDSKDFGPWFRHQACSADQQGSKWFEDATGMWSTPGTTTMLVGSHAEAGGRGWSDKQIL